MIKARFGHAIDHWLQRNLGPLLRRAPRAAWWSGTGVLLSALAGLFLAQGRWQAGALWIAVGALCDLIDGPVARAQGRASPAGAFLDSTLDRAADLAIYIGLMVGLSRAGDHGAVALAGVALGVASLTSYIKARAESLMPALEGGLFERGERLGVLGIGLFFEWIVPALWVLAVSGGVTVAARFCRALRIARSTRVE